MIDKMLSPEEVAERLAVTPNTVRGWLRDGTLNGVKIGKKVWRINETELKRYICCEQSVEYSVEDSKTELSEEDLKAVRRGLEDIKAGRFVTLDDYEQGKRP